MGRRRRAANDELALAILGIGVLVAIVAGVVRLIAWAASSASNTTGGAGHQPRGTSRTAVAAASLLLVGTIAAVVSIRNNGSTATFSASPQNGPAYAPPQPKVDPGTAAVHAANECLLRSDWSCVESSIALAASHGHSVDHLRFRAATAAHDEGERLIGAARIAGRKERRRLFVAAESSLTAAVRLQPDNRVAQGSLRSVRKQLGRTKPPKKKREMSAAEAAISAATDAPAAEATISPPQSEEAKGVASFPIAPDATSSSGQCAENGSCYGDISSITGRAKTIEVRGYYRKDGTYVRGHYRSRR